MSTPIYKGPKQPLASTADGLSGWLGGLFGGGQSPAYKTTPTPAPVPCPPCESPSQKAPAQKSDSDPTQAPPTGADCPEVYAIDYGDSTVIPIPASGGPVTIVIPARP